MGLSVLEIWNRALSLTGTRSDVSSLNERSREAELCEQWYTIVRKQALSAAHWGEARDVARLGKLGEQGTGEWDNTQPAPPWQFVFLRPSNCLHPRHLVTWSRFELSRFGSYNAILTNDETPILVYTKDEPTTGLWTTWLENSVIYGLASKIVRPLTGSSRKTQELVQEANVNILLAREMNANQDNVPVEHIPDWLIARGYANNITTNRYVYPVGPLFNA